MYKIIIKIEIDGLSNLNFTFPYFPHAKLTKYSTGDEKG